MASAAVSMIGASAFSSSLSPRSGPSCGTEGALAVCLESVCLVSGAAIFASGFMSVFCVVRGSCLCASGLEGCAAAEAELAELLASFSVGFSCAVLGAAFGILATGTLATGVMWAAVLGEILVICLAGEVLVACALDPFACFCIDCFCGDTFFTSGLAKGFGKGLDADLDLATDLAVAAFLACGLAMGLTACFANGFVDLTMGLAWALPTGFAAALMRVFVGLVAFADLFEFDFCTFV